MISFLRKLFGRRVRDPFQVYLNLCELIHKKEMQTIRSLRIDNNKKLELEVLSRIKIFQRVKEAEEFLNSCEMLVDEDDRVLMLKQFYEAQSASFKQDCDHLGIPF